MKLLFNIGFFLSLSVVLLLGANLVAYYTGFYAERGGKVAFLKYHYILLGLSAGLIVILGLSHDYFFPSGK